MSLIFNQQVTVLNPGKTDSPYSSEPIDDWENPAETPLGFFVSVQPATSTEGPVERPMTVTTWRMITPPGTDIPELAAKSRVRLGDTLVMDVVGVPERWPDPFNPGRVHHVETTLEAVHG